MNKVAADISKVKKFVTDDEIKEYITGSAR